MEKTIEGELVWVVVAMLVSAASRQVPVHRRLVYRWNGLFLNTEFGCKRVLGLLQKQKSEGVIFTANHAAHFPHLCSHFSGSPWTKKHRVLQQQFLIFSFPPSPAWTVIPVSMFLRSAPAFGCFTLRPNCPGAKKINSGVPEVFVKKALMDETAEKISFLSLCCLG